MVSKRIFPSTPRWRIWLLHMYRLGVLLFGWARPPGGVLPGYTWKSLCPGLWYYALSEHIFIRYNSRIKIKNTTFYKLLLVVMKSITKKYEQSLEIEWPSWSFGQQARITCGMTFEAFGERPFSKCVYLEPADLIGKILATVLSVT